MIVRYWRLWRGNLRKMINWSWMYTIVLYCRSRKIKKILLCFVIRFRRFSASRKLTIIFLKLFQHQLKGRTLKNEQNLKMTTIYDVLKHKISIFICYQIYLFSLYFSIHYLYIALAYAMYIKRCSYLWSYFYSLSCVSSGVMAMAMVFCLLFKTISKVFLSDFLLIWAFMSIELSFMMKLSKLPRTNSIWIWKKSNFMKHPISSFVLFFTSIFHIFLNILRLVFYIFRLWIGFCLHHT